MTEFRVLPNPERPGECEAIAEILARLVSRGEFRSYAPEDRGNCHEASTGLMGDLVRSGEVRSDTLRWKIVQGVIDAIGDHTWLECGEVVIDASNGMNVIAPKAWYYDQQSPREVKAYTPQRFLAVLQRGEARGQ